jgi:hemolysin activation/secretion protein
MRAHGRLLIAFFASAWISLASAQQSEAPPVPRFDIQGFVVQGNTILDHGEIDSLLAPFTGKSRDFGDVQRALEALQDAYISRGFNAVRVVVPEQDLVAGKIRMQVIEAKLRRVRIEGNRHFSNANLRYSLPTLKEGESPNTRRIGENAQLVNENPAKSVRIQLQAADEEAKVDALVRVEDEVPWRVSLFGDNTGTPQTGRYRAGVGYQYANLANRDQVFTAQAITSPTKASDVSIFGLGYHAPVYGWRGSFDVIAGYSDVSSGTVQDLFTVSGSGTIFGLRYNQILPRIDTYEQKLSLGWDYRKYNNSVVFLGTTESLIPDITVRPLALAYSGRLSRVGSDLSAYLAYSRNLPGGPDGDEEAFAAQRPGAKAKYSILRFGAAYTHTLPADFLVRAVFDAQRAKDPLVTAEQYGMGGMNSVRGYFEREVANDVGRRVSLEGYTPDFGSRVGATWRARALVFFDAAKGSDREPVRTQENTLSSAGLGVRVSEGKSLSFRLDWARVRKAAGAHLEGDSRGHFSFVYSF